LSATSRRRRDETRRDVAHPLPLRSPSPTSSAKIRLRPQSAIRQAGLKPLVLFRKTTDQTENGNVIDEQPAAGASIPHGSYVAIFVGRFSG
jgi:hypothetical protein